MFAFGLGALFLLVILVFALPRQQAAIPFLLCICYMTLGLQLNLGGLHLPAFRIMAIASFVRVAARRELSEIRLTKIDIAFMSWALVGLVAYTVLYGTSQAFIYKSALFMEAMGSYFFFRSIVKDLNDVTRIFKFIGIIIIPLSVFMLYESRTMNNLFAGFSKVADELLIRNGKLRCEGPFRHPILAGMFGATVMPFIFCNWWREKRGTLSFTVSFIAAAIITYTATTSGAIMTVCYEVIAFLCWFCRDKMSIIRRSIVVGIIALTFIMKAPIWYLIARIGDTTGGGGYHRAYLLDIAFKEIGRWWLIGTTYTADWFPYHLEVDPNKCDMTNYYLAQGINGGLITMILFIAVIVYCYKSIGSSLKALDLASFGDKFIVWTLGVTLFGHVMGFISVSYFDQINGMWYMLLAMISSVGYSLQALE